MDIGEPIRKVTVIPLNNPIPESAPEPERRETREPQKIPEQIPA